MFGRRRRVAPVIPAPVPAPLPELSDAQVFQILQLQLARLVGAQGQWTLVPRSAKDTDVIFHGLKAEQIAASLTDVLRAETSALRGEVPAEPTALSWTPGPISVWAEPAPASANAPVHLPGHPAAGPAERARLVA